MPVFDDDQVVAALSTAAPAYRMTVEGLVGHLPTLNEAAKTLSVLMALR